MNRSIRALPVVLFALTAGCASAMRQLTADSTADMLHAAAPQFNTLADLEFAEAAVPANLITMESVWRVTPHNTDVLIELAQGYAGAGYAFYEDHVERAMQGDDEIVTEQWRARTREAYLRGRVFGMLLMNERRPTEGGPMAVYARGLEPWRAYLQRFSGAEDAPALFWTANAWLSWIQQSLDDPNALLDLPFAVALMERVRTLDAGFYHGGVHAFFGLYYSATPRELGGRPDDARREFETALQMTQRRLLIYQLYYARSYAVMMQDRGLFRRLLREVIDAGDVYPEERLTNQVAKRRAIRYLAQIDELFGPDATDGASSVAPTAMDAR